MWKGVIYTFQVFTFSGPLVSAGYSYWPSILFWSIWWFMETLRLLCFIGGCFNLIIMFGKQARLCWIWFVYFIGLVVSCAMLRWRRCYYIMGSEELSSDDNMPDWEVGDNLVSVADCIKQHRMHNWACRISYEHCDVIPWKRFPHNWPFVRGIHRYPVDPTHKGPVMWGFEIYLLLARTV